MEFNAQRVFDPRTILVTFSSLRMLSFAVVDDTGMFHPEADPAAFIRARSACGMFELTKAQATPTLDEGRASVAS